MYAVISTGGKQYRVRAGDKLRVEKLAIDEGSNIDFDKILLIGERENVTVGTPFVVGGRVSGTVTGHGRHKKIQVVKFKRRKKYRRLLGHRQWYTEVQIDHIEPAGLGADHNIGA